MKTLLIAAFNLSLLVSFTVPCSAQNNSKEISFDTTWFYRLERIYGQDTAKYTLDPNVLRPFYLRKRKNNTSEVQQVSFTSSPYSVDMLFHKGKIVGAQYNGCYGTGFETIEGILQSKGYHLVKGTYLDHWESPDKSIEVSFFNTTIITIKKKGFKYVY